MNGGCAVVDENIAVRSGESVDVCAYDEGAESCSAAGAVVVGLLAGWRHGHGREDGRDMHLRKQSQSEICGTNAARSRSPVFADCRRRFHYVGIE